MPEPDGGGHAADRVVNDLGHTVFVDPTDQRGETVIRLAGEVYPDSMALWRSALGLLDEWDVVVDVGANYGEMLAGADLSSARRIIAFEPNPVVAACLRRTIDGLPWQIELVERAVSDRVRDSVDLIVTERWSGTSHLSDSVGDAPTEGTRIVSVPQTTLSDHLSDAPLRTACIKVDVEGFEEHVIHGAGRLFEQAERVAMMIEILHTAVEEVWEIARKHPLYVLERESKRIVRWDGADAEALGADLHSGRYYRQDAIILGGRDVDDFDTETRSATGTTSERSRSDEGDGRAQVGEARRAAADALDRLARSERDRARQAEQIASLGQQKENATAERDRVKAQLDRITAELHDLRTELHDTRGELDGIKQSRMYRLSSTVWAVRRRMLRR